MRKSMAWLGLSLWLCAALAQAQMTNRSLEVSFIPTERAQIAVWIENEAGDFLQTLALTEAVALRGIGNRPGALQMNSGFHWPYGRREGVLPVWAHRRAAADDAEQFKRVIFQKRTSEGFASRTSVDASVDEYFCLSFDASTTRKEALDAVTCASVFNSDKGRFIKQSDINANYAEPFVNGETESMRELSLDSLYPPRRDLTEVRGDDHDDAGLLASEALSVMPELDAITKATPAGEIAQQIAFAVPNEWPNGNYSVFVEVNVEGDYNDTYNDETFPTPESAKWDFWAETYGYPYRGQPSVVYRVDFVLNDSGSSASTVQAIGYGALHGEDGNLRTLDGTITDDPTGSPGSGADRLRENASHHRVELTATSHLVCGGEMPAEWCGQACDEDSDCPAGEALCGAESTCVGICEVDENPAEVLDFSITRHPNRKLSHRVARLHFTIPNTRRELRSYRIQVSREANMTMAEPGKAPAFKDDGTMIALPGAALQIPTDEDCVAAPEDDSLCEPFFVSPAPNCEHGVDHNNDGDCLDPGDEIETDIAFTTHQTKYYVTIETEDACLQRSEPVQSSVTTDSIKFTKVSACFIATAAYGTPYANDVGVLREFRDRYLITNAPGRLFVRAYYWLGPYAADAIREHAWLADLTRAALQPLIRFAHWLVDDDSDSQS